MSCGGDCKRRWASGRSPANDQDTLLPPPKLTIPENNSKASIRVYGNTIELAETLPGG
jgi:hypothetical protein